MKAKRLVWEKNSQGGETAKAEPFVFEVAENWFAKDSWDAVCQIYVRGRGLPNRMIVWIEIHHPTSEEAKEACQKWVQGVFDVIADPIADPLSEMVAQNQAMGLYDDKGTNPLVKEGVFTPDPEQKAIIEEWEIAVSQYPTWTVDDLLAIVAGRVVPRFGGAADRLYDKAKRLHQAGLLRRRGGA